MSSREINEIEGLYLLEDLAEEYESQNGLKPFNLSHWDPSEQTIQLLLKHLRLPPPAIGIPYIYSYPEGKEKVLQRIGFTSEARRCWFVNAGTTAVLLGVWWLKAQNIKQVLILGPTYFPVFHVCEAVNLPSACLYMKRINGRWQLPQEEITSAIKEAPTEMALWVTNPVFSTGCYLSEVDVAFLSSMLDEGVTIVADECLSISGKELSRALGSHEQFLGLYSPHKVLSINSTKFAALVFDHKYEDFFDGWTDVLAGPLASSTYSAILHFLGENFFHFQEAFFTHIHAVRKDVVKIIRSHDGFIETDEDSVGNFITCYARGVPGHNGHNEPFLRDLIWNTGATLIPGVRSHFDPELDFTFRINLARGCSQFYAALQRMAEYLKFVSSRCADSSSVIGSG
jgi:aspartate/methionine/tyrosine aminotransferase